MNDHTIQSLIIFDGVCRVRPLETLPDSGDILQIGGTEFFIIGSQEAFQAAMDEAIADLKAAATG